MTAVPVWTMTRSRDGCEEGACAGAGRGHARDRIATRQTNARSITHLVGYQRPNVGGALNADGRIPLDWICWNRESRSVLDTVASWWRWVRWPGVARRVVQHPQLRPLRWQQTPGPWSTVDRLPAMMSTRRIGGDETRRRRCQKKRP